MTSHLIALGVIVAAGCASSVPTPPPPPTHDGFPLARFDRVTDGVYRSSQPSADEMSQLVARYGLKSVVKLNSGRDPAPAGVEVILRGLSPLVEPTAAQLDEILDRIDAAPKPVLIHCTHGEDRTGLIVALYKMRHGARMEDVYVDMVRHGFHPYAGLWRAWIRAAHW